jgi:tRNA-dihydrouridine synthase B
MLKLSMRNLSDKYKNTQILGLKYPLVSLSPLDGVSDSPMRQITKKYGNPDLMYTEFTHVMGLCLAGHNTLGHFHYEEMERPLIAQIYGSEPEYFYHAAKIVCALGFDGVDINMGCPAKNVASSGAGAALILKPELAKEIILETKRGVDDWVKDGKITGMKSEGKKKLMEMIEEFKNRITVLPPLPCLPPGMAWGEGLGEGVPSNEIGRYALGVFNLAAEKRYHIPVSVKTRIGFDEIITEKWISNLVEAKPSWIALHGRTLKQMYSKDANWNEIRKAVELTDIPILANGDIDSQEKTNSALEVTGAFGVLIGRGAEGNPWVFLKLPPLAVPGGRQEGRLGGVISDEEMNKDLILKTMIEHAEIFVKQYPEPKLFVQMRKHFGWYLKGFDGAKELRKKLVRISSLEELKKVLDS